MNSKGIATILISRDVNKDWNNNLDGIRQFKKFAGLWAAKRGYSGTNFKITPDYKNSPAAPQEQRLTAAIREDFYSQLNSGLPMEMWPSLRNPRIRGI